MIADYLALGGVELVNSARLRAYLETVGSPLTGAPEDVCGCPTFTAEAVGDAPYTTPEDDDAPWYDPDVPESADFAGLLVLRVDGLDDHPVRRTVTGAVAGGAALGPARVQPRTITVTALLLGATCCGVEYGMHWLAQALEGCDSAGCSGDCLTVYNCCPPEEMDPEEFNARHRRTLRRVALVDGPRVVARNGDGCATGECSIGADILTVEFVLTAATPWLWADPLPMLDVAAPGDDGTACVTWCVHGGPAAPPKTLCVELGEVCPPGSTAVPFGDGGVCETAWPDAEPVDDPCSGTCRLAACPDPVSACADPSCMPPAPPVPTPPDTCFCEAVAVNSACYELDLTSRPAWSPDAPMIIVEAGSSDLRRLTITFYERTDDNADLTCEEVADADRCTPHSVYHVGYVPAGGVLTLDGQIGRAYVECGGVCESSGSVWGRDGNPPSWRLLDCDRYCVCVTTDALFPPAADAAVSIALSGRG
ncbi:hypothetical protein [Nonomuraea turcica]|uniref:hypothetical protein n=1 Tax=Nonomuraea sp. G32 TaxID=3067274 RepID=UPI00273C0072|nr:hypothetical protein [Nonomuraea sp. G32]MDP4501079.1 hypothetical protein [Nonomuraea sp. G32]